LQEFPAEHATENERKKCEYQYQSLDQGFVADVLDSVDVPLAGAMQPLL
jgi:hypothetical protein